MVVVDDADSHPKYNRRRIRFHAAVAPLLLAAFVAPIWFSLTIFPDGSPNLDEVGYLSQAEALRSGHLTSPAATHAPYFRPYLSGLRHGRVVFKYQPAWPAFLAAVRAATGSYRPALGLTAALCAGALYAFAYQVTRRRRTALMATALMGLSPFFIVESSTYLAYPASLALLLAAGAFALSGLRGGSRRSLMLAGAFGGLAFFHRSFDAILWAIPFGVLLVTRPSAWATKARRVGWVAAGALPFGLLYLAYNQAVMGSPLTPAFTSSGDLDRFGFGRRASFVNPGLSGSLDFTPTVAARTVARFALELPVWLIGWYFVLVLALIGARGTRLGRPHRRLLVGLAAVIPLGYFFWWGTANAALFGLENLLGPFYWFGVLGPLVVFAAIGLEYVVARLAGTHYWRGLAVALTLAAVVTLLVTGDLRTDVRRSGELRSYEVTSLKAPTRSRSVLVAPPRLTGDLYPRTVVSPDLQARHLVGLDPDTGVGIVPLFDRYPDRVIIERYERRSFNDLFGPVEPIYLRLSLTRTTAFSVELSGHLSRSELAPLAYASVGETTLRSTLLADPADELQVRLTALRLTAFGAEVNWTPSTRREQILRVGLAFGPGHPLVGQSRFELRWRLEIDSSYGSFELAVVGPPTMWHRYVFPNGARAWTQEDLRRIFPRP